MLQHSLLHFVAHSADYLTPVPILQFCLYLSTLKKKRGQNLSDGSHKRNFMKKFLLFLLIRLLRKLFVKNCINEASPLILRNYLFNASTYVISFSFFNQSEYSWSFHLLKSESAGTESCLDLFRLLTGQHSFLKGLSSIHHHCHYHCRHYSCCVKNNSWV